jgi:hypothetical protein
MKTKYKYLKDIDGRTRVTVCTIKDGERTGVGYSIRSLTDEDDKTEGERHAHARAIRALKYREPCILNSDLVHENLYHMSFEGWMEFVHITGGLNGKPKGMLYSASH